MHFWSALNDGQFFPTHSFIIHSLFIVQIFQKWTCDFWLNMHQTIEPTTTTTTATKIKSQFKFYYTKVCLVILRIPWKMYDIDKVLGRHQKHPLNNFFFFSRLKTLVIKSDWMKFLFGLKILFWRTALKCASLTRP